MLDQTNNWARFAVILYDNNQEQFVFSARRYNNKASSYICQLQQQGLLIVQPHSTEVGYVLFLMINDDDDDDKKTIMSVIAKLKFSM